MCTCEWIHYACGHEEKARYIDCKTRKEIANSSECSCGSVDFTVIRSLRPCGEAGCAYKECMMRGWMCCRCGKGPNEGHVCKQDVKPWRWDYFECGHDFCKDCRPWRGERQNGHHGGHSRRGSKEMIRKGLHVITGRTERV